MNTEIKAVIGVSLVVFAICGVIVLILIAKKRNERRKHTGHGSTHTAHATGGHDHHHGNPVATFLKEILKTWYIGIPFGIIFMYWICSPVTWKKFLREEVKPAPDYMAWNYTFNHMNGYTVMNALEIGDQRYQFVGVYDPYYSITLNIGEIGEIMDTRTSPATKRWIKLTGVPQKNSEKLVFNGVYVDEADMVGRPATSPPPLEEWHRFSLIGKKL